jgi:hypothetical protein
MEAELTQSHQVSAGPENNLEKIKHESTFDNIVSTAKNIGTEIKEGIEELPKLKDDLISAGKGIKDIGAGALERNALLVGKGLAEIGEAGSDAYTRVKKHIIMADQDPTKPETSVKQTPTLTDKTMPISHTLHDAHIPGRNEQPKFPPIRQTKQIKPNITVQYVQHDRRPDVNNVKSQVQPPRSIGTTVPQNHRGTFEELTGIN